MDLDKIIELLSYTIPSLVTGLVAFYFFKNHTRSEERKMKLELLKMNQKQALPIKLQAYERMTLYLERINPGKLVIRIATVNNDKNAYCTSLVHTIDQEFEHNMAQQIYLSEKCWNVIIAAKNATIHIIKKTAKDESIENAQSFKEALLKRIIKNGPPSTTALAFLKDELKDFI